MPGTHKYPTISFRISDYERREIDANVEALQKLYQGMQQLQEQFLSADIRITSEEMYELQKDYEYMLKAIIWMLDGAKYLWESK